MLTVARDDKAADIDGWVTLTNGSGTSFKNAKLQLVAGDLNRVRQVARAAWRWTNAEGRGGGGAAWRRRRSRTTTCTRWPEDHRSTTTRPSR